MHAYGTDRGSLAGLALALAKSGYAALTVDVRGHPRVEREEDRIVARHASHGSSPCGDRATILKLAGRVCQRFGEGQLAARGSCRQPPPASSCGDLP